MPNSLKEWIENFKLKSTFYSVLVLIQVLMVTLSVLFTLFIIETLKNAENDKVNNTAKFIENTIEGQNSRALLAAIAVANNPEILKAFADRDRNKLIQVSSETWKQMQLQESLRQFQFHHSTPSGMITFLRMHQLDLYGEDISITRPTVELANQEKKIVTGLEQAKSGYGFRAVVPLFYKSKHIGSLEFGSAVDENFLKKLNKTYEGTWTVVNLDRGVAVTSGDKIVIASLNHLDDSFIKRVQNPPENLVKVLKGGNIYHNSSGKTETVSLFVPVRNFKGDVALYIEYAAPTDYFARVKRAIIIAVLVSLVGLILSGAVIMILYRQITDPISGLVAETEKIKSFRLEDPVHIPTSLYEMKNLIDSIASMKIGLQSFKKYVPSQLVRQLIETKQEAKINGQRRELTILFSDIADFTSISESLTPRELTEQLSQYLNDITNIILQNQGTVDKYIGDAIMAFWGAPLDVKDHAYQACLSALKIREKIKELNSDWAKDGKPAFHTRIGLNSGDVIVGNMGSNQRLNYTVIGDPVNLASRLEALNKYYHTIILVSEFTRNLCKDEFEMRVVDYVIVKGKSEAVTVYELIAEKGEVTTVVSEFLRHYAQALENYLSRNWAGAIKLFTRLTEQFPEDYPSKMFLQRSQEFLQTPPHEDWSGEYAHKSK